MGSCLVAASGPQLCPFVRARRCTPRLCFSLLSPSKTLSLGGRRLSWRRTLLVVQPLVRSRFKMLASPLLPSSRFTEDTSYRPAKDLDAFNKLLPPKIEFVEGSSSGVLAVGEGKYQPINEVPKKVVAEVRVPVSTRWTVLIRFY